MTRERVCRVRVEGEGKVHHRRGVRQLTIIDRIRAWFALDWVGGDAFDLQSHSEITPSLLVGRRPHPDAASELTSRGVTHVVSCLEAKAKPEVSFLAADFDHLFLPITDDLSHSLESDISTWFDFIDAARASNPKAKVLVHCEVGVSRSASLAIALLMRDDKLTYLEAFEQVRGKRVQVLPNLTFASELQRLEHRLQPDRETERPSSLAVYLTRYCNAPCPVEELDLALACKGHDAAQALRHLYGGEIPRVVQGTRSATGH